MFYKNSNLDIEYGQYINQETIGLVVSLNKASADQMDRLYHLIMQKMEFFKNDFMFAGSMELGEYPCKRMRLSKKDVKLSEYREGAVYADALYKSSRNQKYKTFSKAYNSYFEEQAFAEEEKIILKKQSVNDSVRLNYKNFDELLQKIQRLIQQNKVKINEVPSGPDMGFTLNFFYNDNLKDTESSGYYGDFQWELLGYVLDYKYEEIIEWMKQFLKEITLVIPESLGHIYLDPVSLSTSWPLEQYFCGDQNSYAEEQMDYLLQEKFCRHSQIKRIEWYNFFPEKLIKKIDDKIFQDNHFEVTVKENGIEIQMNCPITEVTIQDRLALRTYINPYMLKGISIWENESMQTIRAGMANLPIFPEEIHVVSSGESYGIMFISDNDPRFFEYLNEFDRKFETW